MSYFNRVIPLTVIDVPIRNLICEACIKIDITRCHECNDNHTHILGNNTQNIPKSKQIQLRKIPKSIPIFIFTEVKIRTSPQSFENMQKIEIEEKRERNENQYHNNEILRLYDCISSTQKSQDG